MIDCRKKISLIGVCLFLISTLTHAASDPVERIQHTYQTLQALSANFSSEVYVASLQRSVPNHGTLLLKKGGKLRIEYLAAPNRMYVSDGKALWIATPGDAQVLIQPIGKSGIAPEALLFLSGFGNLNAQFEIISNESHGKTTQLTLQPRKKTTFTTLDTTFNERGLLTDLVVHNISGGTATYHFTALQVNPNVSDAAFVLGRN